MEINRMIDIKTSYTELRLKFSQLHFNYINNNYK